MLPNFIDCLGEARYCGPNQPNYKDFSPARIILEFSLSKRFWQCKLWFLHEKLPRINYDLKNPHACLRLHDSFMHQVEQSGLLLVTFRNGVMIYFRQHERTELLRILADKLVTLSTCGSNSAISYAMQPFPLSPNKRHPNANYISGGDQTGRSRSSSTGPKSFNSQKQWRDELRYNNKVTHGEAYGSAVSQLPNRYPNNHESRHSGNSDKRELRNGNRPVLQETSNVISSKSSMNGYAHEPNLGSNKSNYSPRTNVQFNSGRQNLPINHRSAEARGPYAKAGSLSPINVQRRQSHPPVSLGRAHFSDPENRSSAGYNLQRSFRGGDQTWPRKRNNFYGSNSPRFNRNHRLQNTSRREDDPCHNGDSINDKLRRLASNESEPNRSVSQPELPSRKFSTPPNKESYLDKGLGKSNQSLVDDEDNQQPETPSTSWKAPQFYGTPSTNTFNRSPVRTEKEIGSNSTSADPKSSRAIVPASKKRTLATPESNHKRHKGPLSSENKENRDYSAFGLENIGNSCYINSVLQMLFASDCFILEVLKVRDIFSYVLPRGSFLGDLCELYDFRQKNLQSRAHSDKENKREDLLQNFRETVAKIDSVYKDRDSQQDCQEFFGRYLEKLKDEIHNLYKSNIQDGQAGLFSNPVSQNFCFTMEETLTCQKCHKTKSKEETYCELSLHLPNSNTQRITIESLLEIYFKPEIRERQCEEEGCNHEGSNITTVLCQLPRILVIQLSRIMWDNGHRSKDNRPVRFPKYMTLQKWCSSKMKSPPSSDNMESLGNLILQKENVLHASVQRQLFSTDVEEKNPKTSACNQQPMKKITSHEILRESPSIYNCQSETISSEKLVLQNRCDSVRCVPHTKSFNQITAQCIPSVGSGLNGGYPQQEMVATPVEEIQSSSTEDVLKIQDLRDCDGSETFSGYQFPTTRDEEREQMEAALAKSLESDNIFLLQDDEEENAVIQATENSITTYEEQQNKSFCSDDGELGIEELNKDGSLPHSYCLYGMICHTGTPDTGHFTSQVYQFQEKKWLNINDQVVKEVSEKEIFTKSQHDAYVLFYIHKDICNKLENKIQDVLEAKANG